MFTSFSVWGTAGHAGKGSRGSPRLVSNLPSFLVAPGRYSSVIFFAVSQIAVPSPLPEVECRLPKYWLPPLFLALDTWRRFLLHLCDVIGKHPPSPGWHRNQRSKRHRAKLALAVPRRHSPRRISKAIAPLSAHHGSHLKKPESSIA